MENPKTTVAGYAGLAAAVMAMIGQGIPGLAGAILTILGVGLSGALAAIGNIASKDGGH